MWMLIVIAPSPVPLPASVPAPAPIPASVTVQTSAPPSSKPVTPILLCVSHEQQHEGYEDAWADTWQTSCDVRCVMGIRTSPQPLADHESYRTGVNTGNLRTNRRGNSRPQPAENITRPANCTYFGSSNPQQCFRRGCIAAYGYLAPFHVQGVTWPATSWHFLIDIATNHERGWREAGLRTGDGY